MLAIQCSQPLSNAPAYAMQVLSVFQERRIISDETARFEELLVRQRDFFVEEELKEKYKRLISFVQQTEKDMSSAETGEHHRLEKPKGRFLLKAFQVDIGHLSHPTSKIRRPPHTSGVDGCLLNLNSLSLLV